MFWMKLVGWLTGLNPDAILGKIADIYATRVKTQLDAHRIDSEAQTAIALKSIEADVENFKLAQQLLIVEQGWWATRIIRPEFAHATFVYYCALIADSIFHLGWKVAALPEPFGYLAAGIIGSYFLLRPLEKNTRAATLDKLGRGREAK